MTINNLVDPELRQLAEAFSVFNDGPFEVQHLRAMEASLVSETDIELPANIILETHIIEGPSGNLSLPVLRPRQSTESGPVILFIHGGGYITGSPETTMASAVQLASQLECPVVCARYRLAPEFAAPAALNDCYAILEWLQTASTTLGFDPSKITIWGESAGGGLAAATCLRARDQGKDWAAFQMLIYPMLDDRTISRSDLHANYIGWTPEWNTLGWTSYLGEPSTSEDFPAEAVPARATSLKGLPPTYIGTAALDLFVQENLKYAGRLLSEGVSCELHVAPGAFHGFELEPSARVTQAAINSRYDAFRRAFS